MIRQDVMADLEDGETTNANYPWPIGSIGIFATCNLHGFIFCSCNVVGYLLQFCTFDI